MRWFKRLVVRCTVNRVMPLLVTLVVIDLLFLGPALVDRLTPARGTPQWVLLALNPVSWRGGCYLPKRWRFAYIENRWVDTADLSSDTQDADLSPETPQATIFAQTRGTHVVGLLVPWVKRGAKVSGITLHWQTPPAADVTAEMEQQVRTAYAIARYGDDALAQYLPEGGMYQTTLIPMGLLHDAAVISILMLCLGRFVYRQPISRYLSRKQWQDRVPLCPSCKYDRAGLLDRPCPECGWGASAAKL